MRVFIVDDQDIVRRGVIGLCQAEPDIEIVGEAATAAQARSRILATRPDVAVLDMRLPDGDGIAICRDVRSRDPGVRCIILTAYDDDEAITSAVMAGASAYVLKEVRGNRLVETIRAVSAGAVLIDAGLSHTIVERIRADHEGDPRLSALSTRESEVLALIADGLTNREIGERLSLAEKTVKNYVSSLLGKLGLQRRTQAAALHLTSRPPTRY
ncbi:DNA-binding response regulator, NarL/FixJ family, contains REC and HTH domains [Paramicrobacterium humi]|uniref:DNA-binding response regulator, NarL/FixJ family, contains REC and HTH domains n=1 Tax=Paramicrobacterium humi TaxID=640635 RepID=A0A1H4MQQ7_9MICO|nr:response regulator transcription factor [Microbacterium humi]SEB85381.1 DNA-binding response regulator, NarL/FixJ family, contains REC and HTH domains [Microbacterium humi]